MAVHSPSISKKVNFINTDQDKLLFFATLRKRVDAYFRDNKLSKHYNSEMVIKTIVLLVFYIGSFAAIILLNSGFGVAALLWTVMGFAKAGIGMSVMHDANHGAYSSSSRTNYWLGHTLNLVGGSVFNWKLQHNILHHTYTNIVHMDDDVADKAIMRFSPHTKVKWYHKLQFLYAFVFYGILTLYWTVLKDFVQFFKYIKNGTNKNTRRQNAVIITKIILSKIIYVLVFFILPVIVLHVPYQHILFGFLIMHFIAGVLLTVVFQLAHAVADTTHPVPDSKGNIENTWAIHQMNTTANFSRKNRFLSWYLGGLNFQVEHHLFPSICHVHYPEISKIVKSTAGEYGVPYLEYENLSGAIRSHISVLRRFGKLPNINEAIV